MSVPLPAPSSSDVRTGGTWTLGQRIKNDLLYALVRASLALCERLPPTVLRWLGGALGWTIWAVVPNLKRVALDNVSRALPNLGAAERARLVARAYRELGALLGETVATLNPRRQRPRLPFVPGSLDVLRTAHAEGRGVVFASAHLGPWERVAETAAAEVPLTVVAREPYDPRLSRIYARLRADRGIRAVYRGDPGAGIALVRELRRGGVLAIPMDLATRAASIDAPFLDLPARSPVGPARLAIRTGAVVVVGTVAPHGDGLGLLFERLDDTTDEAALTTRINAVLSRRIRALPHLWPWMHPRFERSPGERP